MIILKTEAMIHIVTKLDQTCYTLHQKNDIGHFLHWEFSIQIVMHVGLIMKN